VNDTRLDEVEMYVGAVRAALVDLPEEVVQELTEDLPQHLTEVLTEDGGPLAARLGTPVAYAAELRVAAGATGPASARRDGWNERWAAEWADVRSRLDTVDTRTGPLFGYARASEFLVLLRPAWWVLRGYLAAMVLAYLLDDSGQPIGLLPRIGGSEPVAVLLLAGAILASVWLGRRSHGLTAWPQRALHASTAILVLVALGGFLEVDSDTRGSGYQDVYHQPGRLADVHDVYVYDGNGRLMTDVRLFDQDGRPIELDGKWCNDGTEVTARAATYPYCPAEAPFRLGEPAPSATASDSPSGEPSGTPSAGPSGAPTVSPTPSPSR
jgi:hypothetical protein